MSDPLPESRLRQTAVEVLSFIYGDHPNPTSVVAGLTMVAAIAIAIGGTLGGGLVAVPEFVVGIGGNVFASWLDRMGRKREGGAEISDSDLEELQRLVSDSNLAAQLRDEVFYAEVRKLFKPLESLSNDMHQISRANVKEGVEVTLRVMELSRVEIIDAVTREAKEIKNKIDEFTKGLSSGSSQLGTKQSGSKTSSKRAKKAKRRRIHIVTATKGGIGKR
jgi:hypothetical protein